MRINVIDPVLLSDQHLRAEYREILMAQHYYVKSLNSKKGIDYDNIPKQYTLNQGHAKFFYNKFGFVFDRHDALEDQMKKRGFKTRTENKLRRDWISEIDKGSYKASYQDKMINCGRIYAKILLRPLYYKLLGVSLTKENWLDVLTESGVKADDIISATIADRFYEGGLDEVAVA